MPWSISEALDVVKWIIETHGGNDDLQAWRQICAYIAEVEEPSRNKPSVPCVHENYHKVTNDLMQCNDCDETFFK